MDPSSGWRGWELGPCGLPTVAVAISPAPSTSASAVPSPGIGGGEKAGGEASLPMGGELSRQAARRGTGHGQPVSETRSEG